MRAIASPFRRIQDLHLRQVPAEFGMLLAAFIQVRAALRQSVVQLPQLFVQPGSFLLFMRELVTQLNDLAVF